MYITALFAVLYEIQKFVKELLRRASFLKGYATLYIKREAGEYEKTM